MFVLATGMLLCILTGGNIDLSVGSVVCFTGAIGSILSGHDAVKMGDGTGVSLLTALAAAHDILEGK